MTRRRRHCPGIGPWVSKLKINLSLKSFTKKMAERLEGDWTNPVPRRQWTWHVRPGPIVRFRRRAGCCHLAHLRSDSNRSRCVGAWCWRYWQGGRWTTILSRSAGVFLVLSALKLIIINRNVLLISHISQSALGRRSSRFARLCLFTLKSALEKRRILSVYVFWKCYVVWLCFCLFACLFLRWKYMRSEIIKPEQVGENSPSVRSCASGRSEHWTSVD